MMSVPTPPCWWRGAGGGLGWSVCKKVGTMRYHARAADPPGQVCWALAGCGKAEPRWKISTQINISFTPVLLCWCCASCSLVPCHMVLQVGRAREESSYTNGKGRQGALPIMNLPCSPQCSPAGQLRIRQMKAKVQENSLFTPPRGHRASLWWWVFEGDAWTCSVPPLNQILVLSLWAAKFSHACLLFSFFSSDKQQDYETKLCKLIVYFWRGVLELYIVIPSAFIHFYAEMSKK